jgi:DNA-binding PadR family transcriptional regulator
MAISNKNNNLQDPNSFLPLSHQDFRVLLILSDNSLHGYGIVKASEAQNDPAGKLELGSLYRIVNRLVVSGLIAETSDPGNQTNRKRRLYRTTDLGRSVARAEVGRLRRLLETPQATGLLHG